MGIAFDKYDRESRTEQISELHKIWTKIYEAIGIQQVPGHEIIRMAATFRHSDIKNRILSAEIATEFLRDLCVQDPHLVFDISEEILDIARKLKELYSNVRLKAVTDILHARFLAIAIMLSTKLDQRDKEALLKKWEKITFLIFGLCRNDSRMKVGDYTNLAQQVVNGLSAKQISTSIDSLIDSQEVKSGFEKLKGSNWYERPDDLLYFLYRYEEYLTDQAGVRINREIWTQIWQESTNKTIEHIYPQADNPGPSWRGKLGKGQKPEKQINRLGNLIILPPGVNSEAGKRPFIDKKKIYSKHRNLRLIEEILRKRDWNKNSIDQRESKLLKWAKATWAQ